MNNDGLLNLEQGSQVAQDEAMQFRKAELGEAGFERIGKLGKVFCLEQDFGF